MSDCCTAASQTGGGWFKYQPRSCLAWIQLLRHGRATFCFDVPELLFANECISAHKTNRTDRGPLGLLYLAERGVHYDIVCRLLFRADLVGLIGCASGNEIVHGVSQI